MEKDYIFDVDLIVDFELIDTHGGNFTYMSVYALEITDVHGTRIEFFEQYFGSASYIFDEGQEFVYVDDHDKVQEYTELHNQYKNNKND